MPSSNDIDDKNSFRVRLMSVSSPSPQLQQQQQQQSQLFRHAESFGDEWSEFVGEEEEEDGSSHRNINSTNHSLNEIHGFHYQSPRDMIIELPPQLHPAVSEGMRKISSCYFSVRSCSSGNNNSLNHRNGSLADILSFLDCDDDESFATQASQRQTSVFSDKQHEWNSAQDLLYHDILMNVFGFLDIDSLTSFSETAHRPNFEVFYYLQLQLQRALLPTSAWRGSGLSPIIGTGRLARLARTEYKAAEQVVQGYLDSNTSLCQMPLSHSLEYIRQVFLMRQLRRADYQIAPQLNTDQEQILDPQQQQQQQQQNHPDASLFSRAALLIALIGAASYTMNSETVMANMDAFMPPAAELPNMLFRVGFVGSLMSAARSFATGNSSFPKSGGTMKKKAEQFAHNMMQALSLLLQEEQQEDKEQQAKTMTYSVRSVMLRMVRAAYYTTCGYELQQPSGRISQSFPLFSPNPYDHLPPPSEEEELDEDEQDCADTSTKSEQQKQNSSFNEDDNSNISEIPSVQDKQKMQPMPEVKAKRNINNREIAASKKTPTGCVGAYRRAISQATSRLVELVKEERLRNYKALSEEEQRRLGTALLDACVSDDGLQMVKDLVSSGIDVEDFYVASDGTETSALHAAALHGASKILEYLCQGLSDDDFDGKGNKEDGGLCQVNLKDANGWTALHFAAGTPCTESIRILARHGADLTVEAANGYTPLHWAMRLHNKAVVEELQQLLSEEKKQHRRRGFGTGNPSHTWPSPPDLSRFFFGGAVPSL